ncbi:MAG: toll/interleukin-1 receptor domain-containing protein [Chitinophagaceae bacterium]
MKVTPENLFWDQLLQLITEGHVVPIVGRDLLLVKYKGNEVFLYPLIAQLLAEYLDVSADDLPEGNEINTVVYRYIEKGNQPEDIYAALKIVMPSDEDLSIPDSLKKLAEIRPLKLFVSTTFDSLLERALNQVRFSGQPKSKVYSYTPNTLEDLPGSVEQLSRPVVYHILGRLSATPAYAVTEEDLLEFLHSLQSEIRQPRILFDELNRTNLLILGCNFEDWLARFFIRTAKRQRLLEVHGSTNYLADTRISSDHNLVLFLRNYSRSTKIYQGNSAASFIDELHYRWFKLHPSGDKREVEPNFHLTKTLLTNGSIFLSYASEDIQAVMKIRDALEEEGLDVFFDKASLQSGDDFEAKLKRSISECALFLPVISKNILTGERRFFRSEWNQAIEESLKVAPLERFIIPVVIDDTQVTATGVPEKFRKFQWERLPGGQTTSNFLDMIRELYRRYQKIEAGAL